MRKQRMRRGFSLRELLVVVTVICALLTVRYPPNCKWVMGAKPLPGCSENHGINNPLQSPHPGGLLVGLVDGSVQFISETTGLAVLLRQAIRDDGQMVVLD